MLLRARGVLPVSSPLIEDGAVAVAGGQIQAVGGWKSLRPHHHSGQVLDLGDTLLLPGLVNAHCHLDYTGLAGFLTQPRQFPDWIKQIVTAKSGWTYSDYAQSWLNGAKMLLRRGVTTVADIEAVPELLPEVWETTPLRVISFLELLNVRSWHSAGQIVQEAEQKLDSLPHAEGRVGLSPHAPYSTSPDLLRHAASTARRRGWPLTTHVAESREELDMFAHRRGTLFEWLSTQRDVSECGLDSPVRYLARQGLLGPDFLAVHANYLAEGDAPLLGGHGASVVHCPRSHAFFRHERFPLETLLGEGVNVCLGTDSLASTTQRRREPLELDMFAEMRALAASTPELSAESILRLATVNGARALHREGQIGELAVGACADLIAIPWKGRKANAHEVVLSHQGDVTVSMIAGLWAVPPPPQP